jgi:hypothetical protein
MQFGPPMRKANRERGVLPGEASILRRASVTLRECFGRLDAQD